MTGPEHYRKAEKAMSELYDEREEGDWARVVADGSLAIAMAAAQVHATLALAAATALNPCDEFLHDGDRVAWTVAAFGRQETIP